MAFRRGHKPEQWTWGVDGGQDVVAWRRRGCLVVALDVGAPWDRAEKGGATQVHGIGGDGGRGAGISP